MARFDVYPNPNGQGYLLDVQSELIADLVTRVVVPDSAVGVAVDRLHPVF